MVDTERLKALMAETQATELKVDRYFNIHTSMGTPLKFFGVEIPMVHGLSQQQAKDNVTAYVALHNAAPDLIAELEAAREVVKAAKAALVDSREVIGTLSLACQMANVPPRVFSGHGLPITKALAAIAAYEEKHHG